MSNTFTTPFSALKVSGQFDIVNRINQALGVPPYKGKKTADLALAAITTILETHNLSIPADLSDVYRADGSSIFTPVVTPTTTFLPPTDVELATARADIKTWTRAPMSLTLDRIKEVSQATVDEFMPLLNDGTINGEDLADLRQALAQLSVLEEPTRAKPGNTARQSSGTARTAPLANDVVLYLLSTTNPKRPGASRERFQSTWFNGETPVQSLTVAQAMERGSSRGDVNWDLDHGFITTVAP